MTPSRDRKQLIMTLAVLAVMLLVFVTWALIRISSWIVSHDHVWGEMDKEGAGLEHFIAENFHIARFLYLPAVEAVVGVVFLFFLWRALSARQKASGSDEAA